MSDQNSDSGKREKRCFYAKESSIIKAIGNEEMVLFLYCKGTFLSANDNLSSLSNAIVKIIEEYKDVFPDEVPGGLLSLRGIERQINLAPGVALLNRPAYKSSPEETKEIRRQVEDLLSKGYVRQSSSPCVIPLLLVPKKDVFNQGFNRGASMKGGDLRKDLDPILQSKRINITIPSLRFLHPCGYLYWFFYTQAN
ncbi:hypothetical protein M9H77_12747 [Catharanthus roseus]|uniref:Uncharacterized protein n=1 Tax=Catharanthus roseus TaxID=4058 RepID=A0ACC0BIH5_CATRO|nr:hypothetical protein M9H77_12747 [Catharanthus roseus]